MAHPDLVDGMWHAIQTTRLQPPPNQPMSARPSVCLHVYLSVCLSALPWQAIAQCVCVLGYLCIFASVCVCVCVWLCGILNAPSPTNASCSLTGPRGTAISQRRCMFYHNLPAVSVGGNWHRHAPSFVVSYRTAYKRVACMSHSAGTHNGSTQALVCNNYK